MKDNIRTSIKEPIYKRITGTVYGPILGFLQTSQFQRKQQTIDHRLAKHFSVQEIMPLQMYTHDDD